MRHLPLFADLRGRPCLVIGGGLVGQRRVELLLDAGATVTVLAPSITQSLRARADRGEIAVRLERFDAQALETYWLVVAATDDPTLNARVFTRAEAAMRFCNVADDPANCSFILPAIIDRAPITVAISSAGTSPTLERWIKGLIESLLPVRVGQLALLIQRWREPVRRAVTDPVSRRRVWDRIVHGAVADACLAGREAAAEQGLAEALGHWQTPAAAPGEAYLVGAGPGSPDLITLRGRQLLSRADVVLYDRLVNPALLTYARREAELIPVGKTPGRPSMTQALINRLLVQQVRAGKRVCRLKGGDPLIFGRAAEELEALTEAGLRFQIVPGISAVQACAAYAGVPLTQRGVARSVVLSTGQAEDQSIPELEHFGPGQTLALYMGVARQAEIAERLMAGGHAGTTPVTIVENGTLDNQRIVLTTLAELGHAGTAHAISSPALLLIGATAALAERYAWFSTPLRAGPAGPPRIGAAHARRAG